ncbi:L-lactate dehydrogenase (quinone) large subunit LdhH [Frisingicoccus sp.]|uniref:L-lactate dehydrogenase (quinone) large subunit LdhH n=1 Tax=Frisingicoccus sp. TaxID=1918627 RepID=UPI003AB80A11
MSSEALKQEIRAALDNTTLARTLGTFCKTYPAKREKAYEGVDFEATRNKISEVKRYAADHVDEMIADFTKNCEARGGHVIVAKSKTEAMEKIRALVKEKNVKTIVKSKSMASEELHFNKVLTEDGVLVQETDLGEFIIALEGNTPVHMVMPALHLNKEEVADLFTDYTKVKNAPIIAEEVKTARKVMREKFCTADMGVSGANVAVADTGTVFTMSNEGNGRMVGALPKIHLYIFGIEKFVKSISDARWIFKALPRNGTGQRIASYVSMYSGATEVVTDKENDTKEKKEFYAVILDEPGRRAILEEPEFRQVFECIRCGACLDVCPAFALVGGHVYGSKVYTGGIGIMLTHFLIDEDRASEIQSLCLQCGRCKEVCGGGLQITDMIRKIRERNAKEHPNAIHKFALDAVSDRKLFHSMLRIASVAQAPFTKGQPMIRHLPMFLSGLTEGRSFPNIAQVPLRDVFPTIEQDVPNPKGKIALFAGCLLDFVYTDLARDVVADLNSIGYLVEMPLGQACCGCPASTMGDVDNARKEAEINIEGMEAEKYDYVVSACPSCTHQLRDYQNFFEEGTEMYKRAVELGSKTFDFCKLFYDLGGCEESGDGKAVKITYHDSCHLCRSLRVTQEQRELLKNTKGVELVEMEEHDNCCGFGGTYSVLYPDIATPILEKKIANIQATGADVVAVDCPGCMMQIRGGLDARGLDIKVKHTAEIIAEKRGLI